MAKSYTYGGFLAAFLPIRDRIDSLAAARAATWAAACIGAIHAAAGVGLAMTIGRADGMDWARMLITGNNLILAAAAAALGLLAWRRQPRWVAVVVLVWSLAKLGGGVAGVALGGRLSWVAIGVPLLASLYAVAGVRGAWALSRQAPPPTEVFE